MADTIKPAHHGWDHSKGGEDPITVAQGPGGQGFAAAVNLPVLELGFQTNQLQASATPTFAINSSYAHNGYLELNAQNAYIAWPVVLAPKGSIWWPYCIPAIGADFGILECRIGTAPQTTEANDGDGLGGEGLFQNYSAVSAFGSLGTFDCYNATTVPYAAPTTAIFSPFRIMGEDGTIGTGFTSGYFVSKNWDGGSGPHWIQLRVTTKNASSTGYRFRISSFGLMRMDDQLLF